MYLVDSGAQYRDGTTDVTRTVHFGVPTAHQRRCYTRVLQGHIALAQAVFPEGTTGYQLDLLARQPLWRDGLNYLHGTGHGVGAFLNVHEGPHSISFRDTARLQPLLPTMTVTNEPGYYETGQFGIRIENVCIVREASTPHNFNGTRYFCLETITMAPIQTSLVDVSILSENELEWLNSYNALVKNTLLPLLDQNTKAWLEIQCAPLATQANKRGAAKSASSAATTAKKRQKA
mmetsp:Transcript_24420/g.61244  ORF Transcript_24420/g.61244 Transcript_24420/m.61244 type:complete len:233 (+) Transcript_24420:194-892(+)